MDDEGGDIPDHQFTIEVARGQVPLLQLRGPERATLEAVLLLRLPVGEKKGHQPPRRMATEPP